MYVHTHTCMYIHIKWFFFFICKWQKLNTLVLINNYEQPSSWATEKAFLPTWLFNLCITWGSELCSEPTRAPPFPEWVPPWHSLQGGMATTRFPFLCTGRETPPHGWGGHLEGGREEPGCFSLSECAAKSTAQLHRREDIWKDAWQVPAQCSASVLLLVAQVELSQLPFPNPPWFVGFGGAAGTGGLCGLGALAAGRRPLEKVLRDGTVQVLHGGRGCHADHPRVLQGLKGCHPVAGVHRE